ncbi:hypothetical protein [Streptantibioticus cattleyicolor]|uniref:hypothetical protein n=1 Tax=Streptantibioticus cattleyicolor TaxID=29303 RepID=UPI001E43E9C2|nr:hypothetical protein [Streptantibioticus cattleyicolor]
MTRSTGESAGRVTERASVTRTILGRASIAARTRSGGASSPLRVPEATGPRSSARSSRPAKSRGETSFVSRRAAGTKTTPSPGRDTRATVAAAASTSSTRAAGVRSRRATGSSASTTAAAVIGTSSHGRSYRRAAAARTVAEAAAPSSSASPTRVKSTYRSTYSGFTAEAASNASDGAASSGSATTGSATRPGPRRARRAQTAPHTSGAPTVSSVPQPGGRIHDTWSAWPRLARTNGSAPASAAADDTAQPVRAPRPAAARHTVGACPSSNSSENQLSNAVTSTATP